MSKKVTVTVEEGKIRGFKTKSAYSGTEFYSFLGVPYGQSTADQARFKDPVKVKSWNNVLDATTEKEGCLQFSLRKKSIAGNENCLYNNIHTTKIPSKDDHQLKAVIVTIHPGAYVHGSPDPDYYGSPEYTMNHDIVYVCVGYRLHLIGHLNLNLKNHCSGNQSLKDIILSLKWIKNNIHVFGGDPGNVTLLGSSSGSAIVHFLLLSPLAKAYMKITIQTHLGLYHKVILMGMYVFNPTLITREEHISLAYEAASQLGYQGKIEEKRKLLNFYKQLDLKIYILSKVHKFNQKEGLQVFPTSSYLPLGESSENSPLPKSPRELIPSTNRIPIMVGFCNREGIMGAGLLNKTQHSFSQYFHKSLTQNEWGWGAGLANSELKQIQKEVADFYTDGRSLDTTTDSTKCDILTDVSLSDVYVTLINVVSTDPTSPVYVYNFAYDGNLEWMRKEIDKYFDKRVSGAFHAADFGYWCYMKNRENGSPSRIVPKDREMVNIMTNFLTTFAKTGNPNNDRVRVDWKPSTPESPCYLNINETLEVKDELLNGERMEFWHKLKKRFQNKV